MSETQHDNPRDNEEAIRLAKIARENFGKRTEWEASFAELPEGLRASWIQSASAVAAEVRAIDAVEISNLRQAVNREAARAKQFSQDIAYVGRQRNVFRNESDRMRAAIREAVGSITATVPPSQLKATPDRKSVV